MPKSGSDLQRLVSTAVVFKRNPEREDIEREFRATEYFYRHFGALVAQPVSFFFNDGSWYLDLRHGGTNLFELVKSGKASYNDFSEATSLLAKLQHIGMEGFGSGELSIDDIIDADTYADIFGAEKPNKADGSVCFTNRVEDMFFNQFEAAGNKVDGSIKQDFLSNYWAVNNVLISAERTIYTDANWRNFVKSLADVISKIDFEKLRLWPAQGDLVNLLEFGIFLTEEQKRALINQYIDETSSLAKRRIDRKDFFRVYEFAAFHRHLELVGYRAKDCAEVEDEKSREENLFAQAYHCSMAQQHLEGLVKSESGEKCALANLRSSLRSMNPFGEMPSLDVSLAKQERRSQIAKVALPALFISFTAAAYLFAQRSAEEQALDALNPKTFSSQPTSTQQQTAERTKLAFLGRKAGVQELYIVDMDYRIRNLGSASDFSWVGEDSLVFTQGDAISLLRLGSVKYTFREERLTFRDTTVSSNGLIAVLADGSKLYLSNSSLNEFKLFLEAPERVAIMQPLWSPDGTYLSFVSANNKRDRLYTIEPASKKLYEGPQLNLNSYNISWSADSRKVAFTSKNKKTDVYVANKDLTQQKNLTGQMPGDSSSPLWLDGESLLFVSGNRIYRISHDGANLKMLTPENAISSSPVMAGSGIVYVSASSGADPSSLFFMGYNGESKTKIAEFSGRRTASAIVKERLFYYSTENGMAVLNAVNLDGSGKKTIGSFAAIALMK